MHFVLFWINIFNNLLFKKEALRKKEGAHKALPLPEADRPFIVAEKGRKRGNALFSAGAINKAPTM